MGYRCPLLEVKTWLDPGDIQQEDHLFCDEGPPDDGILEYILTNRQALAITVASMTCHSNAGIITDDESPLIAPYKTYQKWELLRTMRNSWFISDEWSSLWETQTKVCMPIKAHDITGAAVIKKSFEEADELCRDIINIFRHYGITSSPETNVVDNAQIKLNIVASRTAIIVVHEDDTKFVRDFLEKENIPNGSAIDQMVDGNCIAVEYWRETFSLEWTIVIFVNFHAARSDSIINESIVAMSRARSRLIVLECKKPYPLQ
uniref:Uncharacterized protein n=1 Tax=Plectus sambesii TaxID=2011161 RepID=A0A914XMT4_9BILA